MCCLPRFFHEYWGKFPTAPVGSAPVVMTFWYLRQRAKVKEAMPFLVGVSNGRIKDYARPLVRVSALCFR